jgi:phosphoglycerate dehydrogenase-like enzyme
MKILFHLSRAMLDHCFAAKDLARLEAHQLTFPESSSPEELHQNFEKHASDCDALVTGWSTPPLTEAMLDHAKRLQVIVHSAGSIKHLLPDNVWQRNLRIATCNGALALGVAESTLAMILAGLKGFFPARDWTRAGHWHEEKRGAGFFGNEYFHVREPFEITVGVIGASKTGRHLIELLRPFEIEVLVFDPYLSEADAAQLNVRPVSLETLMRESDVVSLHAPALPSTRHMLKAEHFRAMKDGAIFTNTARGMIVDEAALVTELQTGRIFTFIDVTDPEPPALDHPFRLLPNVVLTPHLAGHRSNGTRRQGRSAVEQLLEFASGQTMHGEITEAMFARMG